MRFIKRLMEIKEQQLWMEISRTKLTLEIKKSLEEILKELKGRKKKNGK